MSGEGQRRIERLRESFAERSVAALLISAPANVRYLTGYTGSNGLALVLAGEPRWEQGGGAPAVKIGGGDVFFTDFRYETQARQQVGAWAPGCEQVIAPGDLLEAAGRLIAERSQGAGGAAGAEGAGGAGAAGGRPPLLRVGFDDREMSVSRHARLVELVGERVELVPCGGVVERLREVKDAGEQRQIADAAELADAALSEILELGLAGRTERRIAIELETKMRMLGAQGASFPTIVASGAHGALPHAAPRDVEIAVGDLVTIDWGAVLDGYCSDCTRTFAAGEPSARAREVYELVLDAQLTGLAAVAPGRSGRAVDAAAREVIERAGEGERFGHGLGHGVGLEVHEGPRLSKTAGEEPLREGNVVTVEPGVYLPGELGVRIEDLLVITADGARNLSSLSKELTIVY